MIHLNSCPICKNPEIFTRYKCRDHLVTSEVFDLYQCPECGFIITQDSPEQVETGRYYDSEDYISHGESAKTFFEKAYYLVRGFMLVRKKNIVRKACRLKTGSILDIGAGTGHFLDKMNKEGWRTIGIEINKRAREYAVSKFGLDIILPGNITSIPDKQYDCVTFWHTLEHIHDPEKLFDEVKRILKPDGRVIAALPNNNSFDAGYYGPYWAAWDVPRHLWHFNLSTFALFSSLAGFKVDSIKVLPFDVFFISVISEKFRESKYPLITGMMKGLFFSLRSFFDRTKSSSMVYILKKQDN